MHLSACVMPPHGQVFQWSREKRQSTQIPAIPVSFSALPPANHTRIPKTAILTALVATTLGGFISRPAVSVAQEVGKAQVQVQEALPVEGPDGKLDAEVRRFVILDAEALSETAKLHDTQMNERLYRLLFDNKENNPEEAAKNCVRDYFYAMAWLKPEEDRFSEVGKKLDGVLKAAPSFQESRYSAYQHLDNLRGKQERVMALAQQYGLSQEVIETLQAEVVRGLPTDPVHQMARMHGVATGEALNTIDQTLTELDLMIVEKKTSPEQRSATVPQLKKMVEALGYETSTATLHIERMRNLSRTLQDRRVQNEVRHHSEFLIAVVEHDVTLRRAMQKSMADAGYMDKKDFDAQFKVGQTRALANMIPPQSPADLKDVIPAKEGRSEVD